MIAGLGPESLKRGEAIYDRVCVNCHGTKDRARLVADVAAVRLGPVQERQRPV